MKKCILNYVLFFFVFLSISFPLFAQQSSLGKNSSTSFINRLQEYTDGLVYDDGSFEDGYGWNTSSSSGVYVTSMNPKIFPYNFNTFYIALTRNGTAADFSFDIVVYDNSGNGGSPGNLIGTVAGVTASNVPQWTTFAWYDFDISSIPELLGGSCYIGVQWDPAANQGFYLGADQSGATLMHTGYASSDGGATWAGIETLWTSYRALGIRTSGNSPCGVERAVNPNPPNGAGDVSINLSELSWTNGSGTVTNKTYFGTNPDNLPLVQTGSLNSSYPLPVMLDYSTTYYWRIVEEGDSCTAYSQTWAFTTEQNPNNITHIDTVYPMSVNYWTGTTNQINKTDTSEVRTIDPELGWMIFDISSIPDDAIVDSVRFHGYVNDVSWPYWSVTPLINVNPITDDAATIADTLLAYYGQNDAYVFSNEDWGFYSGWHSYLLLNNANYDLQNAFNKNWFAVGIVDRDFSANYYINFDGWAQVNKPYLVINYEQCSSCYPPNDPSGLTVQEVFDQGQAVQLNWQDNSFDEMDFQILRKYGPPDDPRAYAIIAGVGVNTEQFVDTTALSDSTYTYGVRAHNEWGYSDTSNLATITLSSLPVELISFTCESNNGIVNLKWTTQTETNNKGFQIERKKINGNYEAIDFVNGHGTTTEPQTYSFKDKNIQDGTYKYRLKQIDYDGTYEYSKEVEAAVNIPFEFNLSQNYPNPFNPETKISYSLALDSKVNLKIYDVLGRELEELINSEKSKGKHTIEFKASELPSGIYFYRLEAKGKDGSNFISIKKMILMK